MRLETEVSIFKRNAIADGIGDAKESARSVDIYQSASSFLNYTPSSNTQVYLPTSITLTPIFTGGLSFGVWEYRLGNLSALADWNSAIGANGVTINNSSHVLEIVPSSTLFTDSCSEIVFRCIDSTGAFAKTVIVSKQIDARSSYATVNSAITNIDNKISLIASADELSDYTTTETLASKQTSLGISADGLLYNAVQSYSILNDKPVSLYNSTTVYSSGDYVILGGKFYRSKINNNVGNMPPNASCWDDVSSTFTYENMKTASNQITSTALGTTAIVSGDGLAEQWADNTQYSVGDLVWNSGTLYKCKTAHTSGSTFSATNWTKSVNGSIVDMFAGGISLAVQSGNGSSSIDLASGVLKLQTSDIATIMANNTLNLSSGVINITGTSGINLGTSSNGVVTINSPNFTLNTNGIIESTGGKIGNFLINYNNDYGLYSELNSDSPQWGDEDIGIIDESVVGKYFKVSAKYNYISMWTEHQEAPFYWQTGIRITPDDIYMINGTDIVASSQGDGTSPYDGIQLFRDVSALLGDVDTLKAKTRKSTSYVTTDMTNSDIKVYTHAVGQICFSHVTGSSPVHAAGAVSSYTAATGISCATPTAFTTFDDNGKRIKFNLSSAGNISIAKFIDAVSTSATINTSVVWVATSYPPFTST